MSLRGRTLVRGALIGLALMLTAELLRVTVGPNFHTVVRRRCYRSSQPSPQDLANIVRSLGIRTVVNLRGRQRETEEWFQPEVDAAAALDVELVNVGLSAYTPPPVAELRTLVHALDTCAEPILLHCHSGSDRTGLAAAAYLLLKTATPLDGARQQIHLRYGHNPWGGAACLRHVLGQYAGWLRAHGWEHQPQRFRAWALTQYK